MTSKAHVDFDPMMMGVRIAIMHDHGDRRDILKWPSRIELETVTEASANSEPDPSAWLHLQDDDARALYEALADYFGHTGHDIRALRKDYDAERDRVDKMLGHLIGRDGFTAQGRTR